MWDFIIIGTGIGGSTVGYRLASKQRFRILFLERGKLPSPKYLGTFPEQLGEFRDHTEQTLDAAGRNTEKVRDAERGDSFAPYVGNTVGGSSALYGMAMERMHPSDFETWPLRFEEIQPYYQTAEDLYHVSPHNSPLSSSNQKIFAHLESRGLKPYRLPLARHTQPDCLQCQGFLCPKPCKFDAARAALSPALEFPGTQLQTDSLVSAIERRDAGTQRVHYHSHDKPQTADARCVILASGALKSPTILQLSNLGSTACGRYLMRHLISLFVLRSAPRLESPADDKELALRDFYHHQNEPLGVIQSFGTPPPASYLRNQPGWSIWKMLGPLAPLAAAPFARKPIIATITEDRPNLNNYIQLQNGEPTLHYQPSADDLRRRTKLASLLRDAFRPFSPTQAGGDDRKGLGHVCGTCRFGNDPATSVLDRYNRVHQTDHLYVTDASFFPTSGGVNPALTVAANALRVADHLAGLY